MAAIVQAYAYGKYLGELNVTFDDEGKIKEASVRSDPDGRRRRPRMKPPSRVSAKLAQPLDELRNKVVAETAEPIEGDRSVCRVQECQMGNLVADAMLARVADQGIEVAIQNSGGLRSSIDAGEVTMGEVLTVLPFQNTLSTFQVTGCDIGRSAGKRREPDRRGRRSFPASGGDDLYRGHQRRTGQPHQRT